MKNVSISAYTTTRNVASMGYPFVESILSMASFADEVVVYDNNSTDETLEILNGISNSKLRILSEPNKLEPFSQRFASKFDGEQKAKARLKCHGNVLFQFDCDEVVDEGDSEKIINCCHYAANLNRNVIFCLPIVEYWGRNGKIRCDIPFYKPRISMNDDSITQGIPQDSVLLDSNGEVYSMSSDSCDYISRADRSRVPYDFSFVNRIFEQARASYFSGTIDKNTFIHMANKFFLRSSGMDIPLVHHYSWFDINRKIENYRDYWGKFWSSLFDKEPSEQNFFFGKPWSEVSDGEISEMAAKIERDTSGWIFHKQIDFNEASKYPYIMAGEFGLQHPVAMDDWISSR